MSKIVTYVCDRCKAQFDSEKQMRSVRLSTSEVPYEQRWETKIHTQEWCKNCCVEFGLILVRKVDQPPPQGPASLEDLIRQIVREEVGES